jgi:hypothetical protein
VGGKDTLAARSSNSFSRATKASPLETFGDLNEYVTSRSGWITSAPGAVEVTMQCLLDSTLPDELRARGYDLVEDGETERILPHSITEMVITEGSTVPIRVTHAGIVKVRRYDFDL